MTKGTLDIHRGREPRADALLLGHIRLGVYVEGKGQIKGHPVQTDGFVFTASDRTRLKNLAEDFGGVVEEYEPQGTGTERWRLVSHTDAFTALFPFGGVEGNFSQAYEDWGTGGFLKRSCDGFTVTVTDVDTETGEVSRNEVPCICAAEVDPKCKVYSRVRLFLPQTGMGLWELRTPSKIAAYALHDQAHFIASLAEGRMNHLPIRVVYEPRTIRYFDPKEGKRRTTTKRVVHLSIAGDATALTALSMKPDRALLQTVKLALEATGRTLEISTPIERHELEAGDRPTTETSGVGDGAPGSGGGEGPVGEPSDTAGEVTKPSVASPAGAPEPPKDDPKIEEGPHKGKRWSDVATEDPAFLEGIISVTRAKKRKELAQAWLDYARPRLS